MVEVCRLIPFRFNETYLLEPEDPMFVQIGNAFVEEYTKGISLNVFSSSRLENVYLLLTYHWPGC